VEVGDDGSVRIDGRVLTVRSMPDGSLIVGDDPASAAWSAASGDTRWVFLDGRVFTFEVARAARPGARARSSAHQDSLTAPMPATVRKVHVAAGDEVRRGDVLVVLEAMKMELAIRAPRDGVVRAVRCQPGELVQPGTELVELA
jgi:3-methylcrotonyl-CoA carboxylase alpha subunit